MFGGSSSSFELCLDCCHAVLQSSALRVGQAETTRLVEINGLKSLYPSCAKVGFALYIQI
jgi:hypothetical protein